MMPDWFLRLAARFEPEIRVVLPELALRWDIDSSKAERVLGWKPRPVAETIPDTAAKLRSLSARNIQPRY